MQIIGHRGLPALAPENTFASFDLALANGAEGLETDIQQTADGTLILMHDDYVDRTTNGEGAICDLTWEALHKLDAGSWFDHSFAGEKIPSLEQFLKRYGNKTFLDLEIKEADLEDEVLEMAMKYVSMSNIIFTSFDIQTVIDIKKKETKARVGYLADRFSRKDLNLLPQAGIQAFCPDMNLVTASLVNHCHELGLSVITYYPPNGISAALQQKIAAQGVDAMIVNNPHDLDQTNKPGFTSPYPHKKVVH